MSRPRAPEPAGLVLALLLAPSVSGGEVAAEAGAEFAAAVLASGEAEFPHTRYYEREMGSGLRRSFLLLGGLWDPGGLSGLKLRANRLEERWCRGGRRAANVDPGFLGLGQLVLATGKPAAHRIYLGQGIYGELEYVFEGGGFRPLPWTYPDYREPWALAFFDAARERHRRCLKERQ